MYILYLEMANTHTICLRILNKHGNIIFSIDSHPTCSAASASSSAGFAVASFSSAIALSACWRHEKGNTCILNLQMYIHTYIHTYMCIQ